MKKKKITLLQAILLVSGLLSNHTVALADDVALIPDYYNEAGISDIRQDVSSYSNEFIDPFTGSLQWHNTDLSIPGNGGFDLKLLRSYNSALVSPSDQLGSFNGGNKPLGVGWQMHMGKVISKSDAKVCSNTIVSTIDNPVLELPDGSSQIFSFTNDSNARVMTGKRWKAECSGAQTTIYAPDGTKYLMGKVVKSNPDPKAVYSLYPTRITDKNGNYADIAYESNGPRMTQITTNDGRVVNFGYTDYTVSSGNVSYKVNLLSSISAAGKTVSYSYSQVPDRGAFYLSKVTRPDGSSWNYGYHPNNGSGTDTPYLLKQVTTPFGGAFNYTYTRFRPIGGTSSAALSYVVSNKTANGGSWNFSYTPGSGSNYDKTVVSGPNGTTTYTHFGPANAGNGTVWRIGTLLSKTVGDQQTETYTWVPQQIATENLMRLGAFAPKADSATNVPLLSQKKITRNGATYTTDYSYDGYGNPTTIKEVGTNGGSRTTSQSYFIDTGKWMVNLPKDESFAGHSLKRTYDGNGNVTSVNNNGVVTSFVYFGDGALNKKIEPRNITYTYSNYRRGTPQTVVEPENGTTTKSVDDAGRVTAITRANGAKFAITYDGLDRITSITPPVGNKVTMAYTYNTKTATRGALVEKLTYDGYGNVLSKNTGGITTTYKYDPLNRKTFESNPNATVGRSFAYDILNRMTKITHADSKAVSIAYEASNTRETDELGRVTTKNYRSYGDPDEQILMSVVAPNTAANVTITRNSVDLPTSIVQAGITRSFAYNANYFLSSETHPETGTTVYGRDASGNMISKKVGALAATAFTYDNLNRVKSITYPTGTAPVSYTYSKTNQVLTETNGVGNKTYTYDLADRLLTDQLVVDGKTLKAAYAYDANDNRIKVTYPQSATVVDYTYDALGRQTKVNGFINAVTYWPSGQVKDITYANGQVQSFIENNRLLVTGLKVAKGTSVLLNSTYTYDAGGNVSKVVDTVDATQNRTFTYDNLNRLATAAGPWGAGTFSYDAKGNITAQKLGTFSLAYAYDTKNRLSNVTGSKAGAVTHDANGNMVKFGTDTYTFDTASQLTCVNCANATTKQAYTYGADGNRVMVTKGTAKTYEFVGADGQQLLDYEVATNKLTDYIYLGDIRIAQKEKTSTAAAVVSYLHNDLLGSPILSTNTVGTTLWKETYQPYGAPHVKSVGKAGRQTGYLGKPYEGATGLSYLGARYYHPVLGRFLSIDPEEIDSENIYGLNRYHYSYNNPYTYKDDNGESPKLVLLPILAKVSDAALTSFEVYSAYQTGGLSAAGIVVLQDAPLQLLPGAKSTKHIVKNIDAPLWGFEKALKASPRAGKDMTQKVKKEVKQDNRNKNGGIMKCEHCRIQVYDAKKSQKGVSTPSNSAQIDHILPKSQGYPGIASNGQVLCSTCNRSKSDKLTYHDLNTYYKNK